MVNMEGPLLGRTTAKLASAARSFQDIVADRVGDGFHFKEPIIPCCQAPFLQELLYLLVAESFELSLLFEGKPIYGQFDEMPFFFNDAMRFENRDGHLVDAVFIVEQLAFILGQEAVGKLTQGGHSITFYQGLDEERLIDVAHPHLRPNKIA